MGPWASLPSRSLGRPLGHATDERTPHQRDRDRIIHASAFRRLKHKTQVFIAHEGDHYRTRLTHSLEVAQIARSIARSLRLNEDLTEAIALAHDLGHPPFGHAGERALDECMAGEGGFDHNVQSLRVVLDLERRYREHDGLNLTWETLEGLAKHNGPTERPHAVIASLDWPPTLRPGLQASLEAQVAAIADDIAYNAHDLDDGLRAGLFGFDDLRALAPVAPLIEDLAADDPRSVYELMRRQITIMIRDVVSQTARTIAGRDGLHVEAVRDSRDPWVSFSPACVAYDDAVRSFLWDRVYSSAHVVQRTAHAADIVRDLFAAFVADPALLPNEWRGRAKARTVADYIAGMTDTYAEQRHREIVGV